MQVLFEFEVMIHVGFTLLEPVYPHPQLFFFLTGVWREPTSDTLISFSIDCKLRSLLLALKHLSFNAMAARDICSDGSG